MSNFHKSTWSLKIGTLMGSFNPIKIYRWVMSHDNEEWSKIWRGIGISKLAWGIWQILTLALKRLKNVHFNAFLLRKVCILYELKKYRGVIFHDTEEWCKIWGKMDLWFGKWHEEFGKFSPEHSKVSELGLWWNSFAQSRKYMSLKLTEELCVMKMKNDAKFEKKLTCHFLNDMRNLMNFDSSTRKSKNLLFDWLLWSEYIMFELKKVQKSYVWWHWILMQNLKENWLVLSKLKWGIWQTSIGWNKWIVHFKNLFAHS